MRNVSENSKTYKHSYICNKNKQHTTPILFLIGHIRWYNMVYNMVYRNVLFFFLISMSLYSVIVYLVRLNTKEHGATINNEDIKGF